MGSTTRKTRNYKEKNSMLAFGHIALPLAAVIAVGLLFIGIKLFFLSPSDRGVVEITPERPVVAAEPARPADAPPSPQRLPERAVNETPSQETAGETTVALAGPITQGSSNGPSGAGDGSSAARPSGPSRPSAPANGGGGSGSQPAGGTSAQRAALTSKFGVQIGAFTRVEGANAVVDEVSKQGYVAAVSSTETPGKTYHRVRVAAGDTRQEAERLAEELKQKGYPVLVVANP